MKAIIVAATLALVGVAVAAPEIDHHGYGHHDHYAHGHDYYAYPKYKYSYGVNDKHTGDYKTAQEYRDGDVTKGSYTVLQPDGILRTVNYIADKGGFKAEVVNKGVAHHAPYKKKVYYHHHHDHHDHHGHHDHGHHGHGYAHGHGHYNHHGHGNALGDDGFIGYGGPF